MRLKCNFQFQKLNNILVKIKKIFNGYDKFVDIYLSKCKKIDKIEKRVLKTNDRLIGSLTKYDIWSERKKHHDVKKKEKENKKDRKTQKRMI